MLLSLSNLFVLEQDEDRLRLLLVPVVLSLILRDDDERCLCLSVVLCDRPFLVLPLNRDVDDLRRRLVFTTSSLLVCELCLLRLFLPVLSLL